MRELLLKYDTDGIHLDFARWGNRQAYDVPSLVLVLEQIARIRTEASEKWDHPVTLSARIPFEELAATEAGEPVFIEALSQWAAAGLLDRFMVCLHEPGRSRLAEEPSLRHYADAVQGTDVEFWLDMYQGTWHTGGGPVRDLEIARSLVAQGVDGGVFYYMGHRAVEWESINWQMKLLDVPEAVVDPHHPRATPSPQ